MQPEGSQTGYKTEFANPSSTAISSVILDVRILSYPSIYSTLGSGPSNYSHIRRNRSDFLCTHFGNLAESGTHVSPMSQKPRLLASKSTNRIHGFVDLSASVRSRRRQRRGLPRRSHAASSKVASTAENSHSIVSKLQRRICYV